MDILECNSCGLNKVSTRVRETKINHVSTNFRDVWKLKVTEFVDLFWVDLKMQKRYIYKALKI